MLATKILNQIRIFFVGGGRGAKKFAGRDSTPKKTPATALLLANSTEDWRIFSSCPKRIDLSDNYKLNSWCTTLLQR